MPNRCDPPKADGEDCLKFLSAKPRRLGTTQLALKPHSDLTDSDGARTDRRMLKKAVRRGRSERRGEAYASVR